MKKIIGAVIALAWLVLIWFLLMHGLGQRSNGAVTSKQQNSVGIQETLNPNAYLLASVADATVLEGDRNDLYTNVRFSPYGTPLFYDETVLFCGNEMQEFTGRRRALVIVYRKVVTRAHKGIACHDLVSVFEVPSPKDNL